MQQRRPQHRAGSAARCTSIATATIDSTAAPYARKSGTRKDSATLSNVDQESVAVQTKIAVQQPDEHAQMQFDCTDYRRFAIVTVDDQPVNFQVDTASDVTIMNKSTWHLHPFSQINAHSASGGQIKILGQRVSERLSSRSILRREHPVQPTRSRMDLKGGDLRNHRRPSMQRSRPTYSIKRQ
ncbi:unnamed protein product [Toxocara canis]|uniref:Peptidase A2 domain-containing protein n=1 Tax=Toxocara canis TaxID=6265 RepID=A0A183UPS1_TOXCA|nr:unnamed protein product [Toxocara canis]